MFRQELKAKQRYIIYPLLRKCHKFPRHLRNLNRYHIKEDIIKGIGSHRMLGNIFQCIQIWRRHQGITFYPSSSNIWAANFHYNMASNRLQCIQIIINSKCHIIQWVLHQCRFHIIKECLIQVIIINRCLNSRRSITILILSFSEAKMETRTIKKSDFNQ